jgi:hypothetical protein
MVINLANGETSELGTNPQLFAQTLAHPSQPFTLLTRTIKGKPQVFVADLQGNIQKAFREELGLIQVLPVWSPNGELMAYLEEIPK